MQPTWSTADGSVQLYLGDCRRIAHNLEVVDAIITDPVWPNAPEGMFDIDTTPEQLLACGLMVPCKRIAVILRTDSDPRILKAVPSVKSFVRHQDLEYVSPGYLGRVLGGIEVVYGFGDPIMSAPGRRVIPGRSPRVQPVPQHERVDHPCPRHITHMVWVVYWWSDEGETVLDPFMGSGTTGVACVRTGRRFIGIEKEPKYFDIAVKRITDELNRQPLFEPAPEIVQRELL